MYFCMNYRNIYEVSDFLALSRVQLFVISLLMDSAIHLFHCHFQCVDLCMLCFCMLMAVI